MQRKCDIILPSKKFKIQKSSPKSSTEMKYFWRCYPLKCFHSVSRWIPMREKCFSRKEKMLSSEHLFLIYILIYIYIIYLYILILFLSSGTDLEHIAMSTSEIKLYLFYPGFGGQALFVNEVLHPLALPGYFLFPQSSICSGFLNWVIPLAPQILISAF